MADKQVVNTSCWSVGTGSVSYSDGTTKNMVVLSVDQASVLLNVETARVVAEQLVKMAAGVSTP